MISLAPGTRPQTFTWPSTASAWKGADPFEGQDLDDVLHLHDPGLDARLSDRLLGVCRERPALRTPGPEDLDRSHCDASHRARRRTLRRERGLVGPVRFPGDEDRPLGERPAHLVDEGPLVSPPRLQHRVAER